MAAIDDRSVQQPSGSMSGAIKRLGERRSGDRILRQTCVRLTDRAVGLSSVMPSEMLSGRHDALPASVELDLQVSTACNPLSMLDAEQMDHAPPDAGTAPPCRPELDEGEEHRETTVRAGSAIRQDTGL
jgi:hypothetical protein